MNAAEVSLGLTYSPTTLQIFTSRRNLRILLNVVPLLTLGIMGGAILPVPRCFPVVLEDRSNWNANFLAIAKQRWVRAEAGSQESMIVVASEFSCQRVHVLMSLAMGVQACAVEVI